MVKDTVAECRALEVLVRSFAREQERREDRFLRGTVQKAVDDFCRKRKLCFLSRVGHFDFWPKDVKLRALYEAERKEAESLYYKWVSVTSRKWASTVKQRVTLYAAKTDGASEEEVRYAWDLHAEVICMRKVLGEQLNTCPDVGWMLKGYPRH